MDGLIGIWRRLGREARIGLLGSCLLIVCAIAAGGYLLLRTSYGVLFTGLSDRDSAAIVAALEKDKVAYRLEDAGGTILLPAEQVHRMRLKVAGAELPLQGGVGFELFNNNEVGMTDFAQKVNYQRALQGELTRTIGAFEEVQSTRVHLALPEQGLFRKPGAAARAKASVAVTLKPGRQLSREQTRGIQRLVAASVPDIRPEDVTVLDQRGIALTSESNGQDGSGAVAGSFEGKREAEEYFVRKVRDVLDQTFGTGQSIARVDVVLNHDQTRVTTESVLPANASNGHPAGVVVREMETGATRDPSGALSPEPSVGTRSRDVQYQVGRRVEQVVSAPGGISRINVAVVVRRSLDDRQIERLKEIVAAAAGLNRMRGDTIAIRSIDEIVGTERVDRGASAAHANPGDAVASPGMQDEVPHAPGAGPASLRQPPLRIELDPTMRAAAVAIAVLTLAIVAAFGWLFARRRAARAPGIDARAGREALLRDVQGWMRGGAAHPDTTRRA